MARGCGVGSGRGAGCFGMACLLCVSFGLGVVLSIVAVAGLCMGILQCVDLMLLNEDLQDLARAAVQDSRLRDAYYVLIASTVIAHLVSYSGHKGKKSEGSRITSCCGSVFSVALMMGNVASGLLGYVYKHDTLPVMEAGMKYLLVNDSYINPDLGDVHTPRYTDIGQHYNYLQNKYECCGVSQPRARDYSDADFQGRYNLPFPYACCLLTNSSDIDVRKINKQDVLDWIKCLDYTPPYFHNQTCYTHEAVWLENKADFIILYNLLLVTLAALSFILAAVLLCWGLCACCRCLCGHDEDVGQEAEGKQDEESTKSV